MGSTRDRLLAALVGSDPRSSRDVIRATGLSGAQVWNGLTRAWKAGLVLRTVEPVFEVEWFNDGRAGVRPTHIRPFHLYLLSPPGVDELVVGGRRLAGFSGVNLDPRVVDFESRAGRVIRFLRENPGEAFFSLDVMEALVEDGVKTKDVMSSVRRAERKGHVYVRGYMTHDRQSPFRRGYISTWIDSGLSRKRAIEEAIGRTEKLLDGASAMTPALERVHRIRDIVLAHSKLRKLVSPMYMQRSLGEASYIMEHALKRALELYSDIREVKLFDAYRYYHHSSLRGVELKAAVEQQKNYVRKAKGVAYRVGHNWEAAATCDLVMSRTNISS